MSRSYNQPNDYRQVIILGAARSGTNLLRDLLCAAPGVATWPCDEINCIWRHSDPGRQTDCFDASECTPRTAAYLRSQFRRQARCTNAKWLVEKTCANCLRVNFVHRVFPDARFIVIQRDGRDVVASALQRWQGGFRLGYLLKKTRFVPPTDLPFYATRFAGERLQQLVSSRRAAKAWGPRFEGMHELMQSEGLEAVCAEQWTRCVEAADAACAQIPSHQILRLSYESLVGQPEDELARVGRFLGVDIPFASDARVSTSSVGGWSSKLSTETQSVVIPRLAPSLYRLGYLKPARAAA